MKKLLVIFGILAMSLSTFASPRKGCGKTASCKMDTTTLQSFHYLLFGGAIINNDAINDRLGENGLGDFSSYAGAVGFGGTRWSGRYVSANEFEVLFWKKNRQDNRVGMLNTGRFSSLHGIRLVNTPAFSLYPLAGIGAGFTTIKVWSDERSFNDALAVGVESDGASKLFQPTFLFDVGIGAHFSKKMPHGKPGMATIGLRAGYVFDPVKSNRWYQGRSVILDGPDGNLSGPYLRIVLGGSKPHWIKRHGASCCSNHKTCGKRKMK